MILAQITDTINLIVNEVVNTGFSIHENTGGGQIINGIDNAVVGSFLTLLISSVVRFFERKRLIKKLKKDE
jgi:hypothetical protein